MTLSNELFPLVLAGRFLEASALARSMAPEQLCEAMVQLAFESESFVCYGLVAVLLVQSETAEHHYLASLLLTATPLNALAGASTLAYFHAQRAATLAPQEPSYLEYLLFFFRHPDKLMPADEAKRVAEALLQLQPTHSKALEVRQYSTTHPRHEEEQS